MSDPNYSIFQVVKDGPLVAPRIVHHLVKVLTHALVTLAVYFIGQLLHHPVPGIVAAICGGPVLYVLIWLHEHFWPSDLQPLTAWQHVADWLNDGSLSLVPLAVVLPPLPGSVLGGAIVATWLACHKDARP